MSGKFSFIAKAAAVLSLVFCVSGALYSQPKSVGLRMGYDIRAVYQHNINGSYFIEAGAGTSVSGGFNTGVMFNGYIHSFGNSAARFNVYWSAGLTTGYMPDRFTVDFFNGPSFDYSRTLVDYGFMLGAVPGIGLECDFSFPLQISVDIRPVIGFHVGEFEGNSFANFYGNGLYGFIPSISVRYRF